jgi:membrane-associated phospholipid phosphatase
LNRTAGFQHPPEGKSAARFGRKKKILGLSLQVTDGVILGGLLFLTALAAVFNKRVERPLTVIAGNLLLILLYLGAVLWLENISSKLGRFLLRTASVQCLFLQIFQTGCDVQRIFFGWQDETVLRLEQSVFGVQPVVWIQQFARPWLTEWMMLVYVVYVVIYPALGAYIFFKHGERANEDYLFHLGLANLVCALGFIVFPVAAPMNWPDIRALLDVPLRGGVFTSVAELIRTRVHDPGGSIPSPHCAVATVMWFMTWRYGKRWFYILAPVILSLYVSTVYGRFHYVTDAVAGIAAAVVVIVIGPAIVKGWNRRVSSGPSLPDQGPVRGSRLFRA